MSNEKLRTYCRWPIATGGGLRAAFAYDPPVSTGAVWRRPATPPRPAPGALLCELRGRSELRLGTYPTRNTPREPYR